MTSKQQRSRINDVLYEVHKDISAPLSARKLAKVAAYSEQHFHRVFVDVVGESVNRYIRHTRLEHAANQLMFDRDSTVLEVAEKCGFQSLSSFSKAFKEVFHSTPGAWRQSVSSEGERHYLTDPDFARGYERIRNKPLPRPSIKHLKPQLAVYVRHTGYGADIREAWQLLMSWAAQSGVVAAKGELSDMAESGLAEHAGLIGLHHSNPALVPLERCRYVACMAVEQSAGNAIVRRGAVNTLTIPGGEHAVFDVRGQYGDLVPMIDRLLHQWLPRSGYKLRTTPILAHYRRNHFLAQGGHFELALAFPVSVL